jgi:hypothetical protein
MFSIEHLTNLDWEYVVLLIWFIVAMGLAVITLTIGQRRRINYYLWRHYMLWPLMPIGFICAAIVDFIGLALGTKKK